MRLCGLIRSRRKKGLGISDRTVNAARSREARGQSPLYLHVDTCRSSRNVRNFLPTMVEFARRIYQLELYMLSVPSFSCCSLFLNARKTVRTLFTGQICLKLLSFFYDKPHGFAAFQRCFLFYFLKSFIRNLCTKFITSPLRV